MTNLIGSEKQIKWAEKIRASKDFTELKKIYADTQAALNAIKFVENINNSVFWIENKDQKVNDIIIEFCTKGIAVDGYEKNTLATIDQATGEILITK